MIESGHAELRDNRLALSAASIVAPTVEFLPLLPERGTPLGASVPFVRRMGGYRRWSVKWGNNPNYAAAEVEPNVVRDRKAIPEAPLT